MNNLNQTRGNIMKRSIVIILCLFLLSACEAPAPLTDSQIESLSKTCTQQAKTLKIITGVQNRAFCE